MFLGFHINISLLLYHIDDFKILLASFDNLPDIIEIIESSLHDKDVSITNVGLGGYASVHMPTKVKRSGTLMYIKSRLNFNIRADLILLKRKEIAIFIEVINSKKSNLIVGCL